jgi:23S rRNA (adenine2503-C2)-methyltransferase
VDPFVKYLFRSDDGRTFEAVRIPLERPRWSVCVSSQAGCALGCAFCETGRLGLERNLEPWEIVEQVLTVRRESPERPVSGVVFQGQGEPFQNYDAVIRAARILRNPCGARIRGDRITISTVGLPPLIDRYTDEGHPYRLILSLTSAFGEKRSRLVPIGRRYDVPALVASMRRHAAARGGPVNLAWVLIAGFNTGPEEARELARLFKGVRVRLSVIDVNDPTGRFARAGDEERSTFLSALAARDIGFVRRYSGGPDIHAACGMLGSLARGGAPVSATA